MSNKEEIQEKSNDKHINIEKKENEEKQQRHYIKFFCCKISTGLIAAYIYLILNIGINLVNRVLFLNYEFTFDYTLIFLQEFLCLIIYAILSWKSKTFKEEAGKISFKDFWKLKYKYIGYSFFFLMKILVSFLGYQIITNIPLYGSLRKLVTPMMLIYQFIFKKKKIDKIKIFVVILFTIGAIFTSLDDFSTDFIGYIVVFTINTMTVINFEISENFKKNNGVSNLKLLAYSSFILPPLLLIFIVFMELGDLIKYFKAKHDFSYFGLFSNLFLSCFISFALTMSLFISNEKIKSLTTKLLSDSKFIFITILSYFILKTFEFTWKNILGLLISTSGAIIITITSLTENVKLKKNENNKLTEEQKIEMNNIDNINMDNTENVIDNNINKDNIEKKIDDKSNEVKKNNKDENILVDEKNVNDLEEKEKNADNINNNSNSNDITLNTSTENDINGSNLSFNDISSNSDDNNNKEDDKNK